MDPQPSSSLEKPNIKSRTPSELVQIVSEAREHETSPPRRKPHYHHATPSWWNMTVKESMRFAEQLGDAGLVDDLDDPQPGRTILLPYPPSGGLTSRLLQECKGSRLSCIQRSPYSSLRTAAEERSGLFLLHGPSGFGKSFALYHLYCALASKPNNRVLYIANCQDLNASPYDRLIPALVAAFAEMDTHFLDSRFLPSIDPVSMIPDHWQTLLQKVKAHCHKHKLHFYALFDQYERLEYQNRHLPPSNVYSWTRDFENAHIILAMTENNDVTEDLVDMWQCHRMSFCAPFGKNELLEWQNRFHFYRREKDLSLVTQVTGNVPYELRLLKNVASAHTDLDLTDLVAFFRIQRSRELAADRCHFRLHVLRTDEARALELKCSFIMAHHLPLLPSTLCVFDRRHIYVDEVTNTISTTSPLMPCVATTLEVPLELVEAVTDEIMRSPACSMDAKNHTALVYVLDVLSRRKTVKFFLGVVAEATQLTKQLRIVEPILIRYEGRVPFHHRLFQDMVFVPETGPHDDVDFFIWKEAKRTLWACKVAIEKKPERRNNDWKPGEDLFEAWRKCTNFKASHKVWFAARPMDLRVSQSPLAQTTDGQRWIDVLACSHLPALANLAWVD